MAFSYASTNIDSSGLSWVRFRVGDTSSGSALLEDAEIEALLDSHPKERAAALAARGIAAWFARRVDKQVGKLRISMAQASEHYFDLADRLEKETGTSAKPYAGGISVSDVESEESDTDRPDRMFSVGQFDHTGTIDGSTEA